MPDWLVVDGLPPYDGRYELELEFTVREWGWIKRHAGYLPPSFNDGFRGIDPELFSVLALIAMHRAGKIEQREVPDLFERLADTDLFKTIRFEPDPDDEEDAASNDADPSASSNGSEPSSGVDSVTSSERSELDPSRTGIPALVSSASLPPGSGI